MTQEEIRRRTIDEIVSGLWKHGCVKTAEQSPDGQGFVLKDGSLSPFYIDLRRIASVPGFFHKVNEVYTWLAAEFSYELIAGVPTAGVPMATALALWKRRPLIVPRLEKKAHGTGATIDGIYHGGQSVLIVDDLITAAKSKQEAIEALRAVGLNPVGIVVLLDRSPRGISEVDGVPLRSLMSVKRMMATALEQDCCSGDNFDQVMSWLNAQSAA